MKFEFSSWDAGGKLIFISSCMAIFSFLLPWADIGIASRNGFSQGTFLLFVLFLYPLVNLLNNKPVNKAIGVTLGTLNLGASYLFYKSKEIALFGHIGNASGTGLFVFIIAAICLIVGIIIFQSKSGSEVKKSPVEEKAPNSLINLKEVFKNSELKNIDEPGQPNLVTPVTDQKENFIAPTKKSIGWAGRSGIIVVGLLLSGVLTLTVIRPAYQQYQKRAGEDAQKEAQEWISKGISLVEADDYKEALAAFNKVIEIDPNNALGYEWRGIAYNGLGDYEQAISNYNKSIEIGPDAATTYLWRGIAYNGLGNYEQAISNYNKSIEIDPNYATTYYNRGVSYGELGDEQRRVDDYKTAAQMGSELAQELLEKADIAW